MDLFYSPEDLVYSPRDLVYSPRDFVYSPGAAGCGGDVVASRVWNRIGAPPCCGSWPRSAIPANPTRILPEVALFAVPFAIPPATVFGLRGNAKRGFVFSSLSRKSQRSRAVRYSNYCGFGEGAKRALVGKLFSTKEGSGTCDSAR